MYNKIINIFNLGTRLDMVILYVFCRITDNLIDGGLDIEEKKRILKLFKKFIVELFSDRKSDTEIKIKPYEVKIDWAQYQTALTDKELSVFRALSRIAFYLPRRMFDDLFSVSDWDIESRVYKNEEDLLLYIDKGNGSYCKLCMYVMMYRCDNDKYELVENYDHVFECSRIMGLVS